MTKERKISDDELVEISGGVGESLGRTDRPEGGGSNPDDDDVPSGPAGVKKSNIDLK